MSPDPVRDCKHGRLKGRCVDCDTGAELERLRAEAKGLRARITQARRLLQARGALERLSALDCLDLKRKNWRKS